MLQSWDDVFKKLENDQKVKEKANNQKKIPKTKYHTKQKIVKSSNIDQKSDKELRDGKEK